VLLMTYHSIEMLHGIRYDFSIPAILVCFFVLLFRKIHYRYISLWKKAVMIGLVLVAFQFLDVMPAMDSFPVGRGETSKEIKMASMILGADAVLNTTGAIGIVLFLSFALLIFALLREENNLKELSYLREQNQAILMQSKLSEMKSRTYQELQYLVHDLKSPLTTVQTLVGVLKMESEAEAREQDVEYLDCIENAVERMSEMISEMLYYDQNNIYTTQTLLDAALAQCSVKDYAHYLRPDNRVPEAMVSANRLLFTRALINLVENAAQAMTHQAAPEILLRVDRDTEGNIIFAVEDNGDGIPEEEMENIWGHGTSGRQSSGMGLAFVQTALQKMNGTISMRSAEGKGTSISLILAEECEETE
jgi:signal transduction histidine kinase